MNELCRVDVEYFFDIFCCSLFPGVESGRLEFDTSVYMFSLNCYGFLERGSELLLSFLLEVFAKSLEDQ